METQREREAEREGGEGGKRTIAMYIYKALYSYFTVQ